MSKQIINANNAGLRREGQFFSFDLIVTLAMHYFSAIVVRMALPNGD